MISSQLRSTKKSTKSHLSNFSKPTKFRVIYKSRSGLFNDDEVKSRNLAQQQAYKTQTSFSHSKVSEIFKSIKNNTTDITEKMNQTPKSKYSSISIQPNSMPRLALPMIRQTPSELKDQQQNPQKQQETCLTLDQIQKKVDSLIQLKLLKTAEAAQIAQKSEQPNQIIKQIQKINQQMQQIVINLQKQNQEIKEEGLQTAKRKINIVQKIMAQSLAQSDIVKRFYYKKINNRKPKKPDLSQFRVDIKIMKQKTKQLMKLKPPASIHYESLCQINYKAPSKEDYPIKQPKKQHKVNKQPLPRSSYDSEYLMYGKLPKYTHKQPETALMPSCIMGKRTSSYHDQFQNKTVQKINFKQLDCYRDKFKNLKIPLIHNSSNITNQTISYDNESQYSPKSKQQRQKQRQRLRQKNQLQTNGKNLQKLKQENDRALVKGQKIRRFKSQHTDNLHYICHLNTESNSNFKGQNNNIVSQIKHKNLYAKKYQYKASVHV